jgi:hypothetical protein
MNNIFQAASLGPAVSFAIQVASTHHFPLSDVLPGPKAWRSGDPTPTVSNAMDKLSV